MPRRASGLALRGAAATDTAREGNGRGDPGWVAAGGGDAAGVVGGDAGSVGGAKIGLWLGFKCGGRASS